jgi:L-ectoine synthase
MFHRSVGEILGGERDVQGEGWRSRRLVLAGDGLPFSLHETTIEAGQTERVAYAAHTETVYCVAGRASVEDVAAGVVVELRPGSLYSVGVGDEHVVRVEEETTFICVFTPPLTGREEAD